MYVFALCVCITMLKFERTGSIGDSRTAKNPIRASIYHFSNKICEKVPKSWLQPHPVAPFQSVEAHEPRFQIRAHFFPSILPFEGILRRVISSTKRLFLQSFWLLYLSIYTIIGGILDVCAILHLLILAIVCRVLKHSNRLKTCDSVCLSGKVMF